MTSLGTYIRGRKRYRVTAAAAFIILPGGGKMLYRGALVPVDSSPRQLTRLLQLGMITTVESEAN